MTYPEALRYLDGLVNYEKIDRYDYGSSIKPDRIRRICRILGDPQDTVRSVHVAGSKGKGSTAAFIHSILTSSGMSAGLYTSPHLVSFRERIRIGERLISEDDVARLLGVVREAALQLCDDEPTFFEIYTALAYLYFAEKRVDYAVYEVGLGGRLDATNIISPDVCVITPISLEHTDKLGSTLGLIAAEKAGIIKKGLTCVSAPQEPEAMQSIEDKCRRERAKLLVVGKDVQYKEISCDRGGCTFGLSGPFGNYDGLSTKLVGRHQIINAACAITAACVLRSNGVAIPDAGIMKGVEAASWPGRLEMVSGDPRIILDGAQNGASAKALAGSIREFYRYKKLTLVIGVSKDKDIDAILAQLLPLGDRVIITKSNVPGRAADPAAIKDKIGDRAGQLHVTQDVDSAVKKALDVSGRDDVILITGSLFVVGEARKIIKG